MLCSSRSHGATRPCTKYHLLSPYEAAEALSLDRRVARFAIFVQFLALCPSGCGKLETLIPKADAVAELLWLHSQ